MAWKTERYDTQSQYSIENLAKKPIVVYRGEKFATMRYFASTCGDTCECYQEEIEIEYNGKFYGIRAYSYNDLRSFIFQLMSEG